MFTFVQFSSEWKRLHHPSMNVDGDVAFFYEIYVWLHRLLEQEAAAFDEQLILFLLLYTENTVSIGLDGVYEYRYRSVGNVVSSWCESLDMSAEATSQVDRFVSEAVTKAPCSALRGWMTLSGDFSRLGEMLTWFPQEDQVMWRIFPDLRFREMMFRRLTGDWQTARQMLWADLAFNWRDKRGDSLAVTIAKQFRYETSFVELDAIHAEQLDTYTVIERNNENVLTLRHRDGRVFQNVIFPTPVPKDVPSHYLAVQLVTYNNKTYISGSAVWLNEEALPIWNGEANWNDIVKKEQDAAKLTYFTTNFGKRISLYEDLYTVPEDPEEAYYADMGIYFDEPNIFDFLGLEGFGFIAYANSRVEKLRDEGRYDAANKLKMYLRRFIAYLGKNEVPFKDFDALLIRNYHTWLKNQELGRNTISLYIRNLKRVYRLAVDDGLAADSNPFEGMDVSYRVKKDDRLRPRHLPVHGLYQGHEER